MREVDIQEAFNHLQKRINDCIKAINQYSEKITELQRTIEIQRKEIIYLNKILKE